MDPAARRLVTIARELLEGGDLEQVLRRVLSAACELTGAQYAALGVLAGDRKFLDRFLTTGLDSRRIAEIGDLPRGHGVLGELIRHPSPLRLGDVSAHPRSYGFPVGHPPMKTFLGAPIMIDGTAYGNLYLTEKKGATEFSEEDEDSLVLLADCAAVAIRHAQRLKDLEERTNELEGTVAALSATSEIHRALAGETHLDVVLELVAKRARALVLARTIAILLVDGTSLRVVQVAGVAAAEVVGTRLEAGSVAHEVIKSGRARRLDRDDNRARFEQHGLGRVGMTADAGLFVPLRLRGSSLGAIVALDRLQDGPNFSDSDEQLLSTFAVAAATAVFTAQTVGTERLREREAAAEGERRRWARELHDETLQGLASVRMALSAARGGGEPVVREAIDGAIEELQGEVERLRAIIHDVRPASLDDLGLAAALEALVARHARAEGPALELRTDLAYENEQSPQRLEPEVETSLYRIAQEAVTNALKHANASRIEVSVTQFDEEVGVRVRDDGNGFDTAEPTTGVGLIGLRERIGLLGGRLSIESTIAAGTTVEARVPVRHRSTPLGSRRVAD